MVTSAVPSHVHVPQASCADLIAIAMPDCASAQLFSKMLFSTSTRRAFLSSNRFLTVHLPFHVGSFQTWFPRIVMSLGERPTIPGSAPPNMTFSPAPARKLFSMRYGPGPFHPSIAWESNPLAWHSLIHELSTAVRAEFSTMQRTTLAVLVPCTYTRSRMKSCGTLLSDVWPSPPLSPSFMIP